MPEDDATVRLPDGRTTRANADDRYAGDRYDEAAPDAPDAGDPYPAEESATTFQPGFAPSYRHGYSADEGEDRTLTLDGSGGGWENQGQWDAPARSGRARDRLLVHVVWEIVLLLLVAALVLGCRLVEPAMFSGAGMRRLELGVATLGTLAIAMSFSLRAAAPNLAVGAFAVLGGVLFVRWYEHGALVSAILALSVAVVGGLAVGVVVGLFHAPAWATSLVAVCGAAVAVAAMTGGRTVRLPADATLPALLRHPLPLAAAVVVVSVVFGMFGLAGPVRRGVGAFRPAADPAERPGPGAAVLVALALVVSAGFAASVGLFDALRTGGSAPGSDMATDALLALGAALLGGVSAYGRRGGMFGTVLGVLAVSLVLSLGAARHWPHDITVYGTAGGAILLGLIVTRLVEWGGRAQSQQAEH